MLQVKYDFFKCPRIKFSITEGERRGEMRETNNVFNFKFLDIVWRLEEVFIATEYRWPVFMFSKIGKFARFFLLPNYGIETFGTDTSQMNLIVSRCHMHCSIVIIITCRWGTRC